MPHACSTDAHTYLVVVTCQIVYQLLVERELCSSQAAQGWFPLVEKEWLHQTTANRGVITPSPPTGRKGMPTSSHPHRDSLTLGRRCVGTATS